MQEQTPEAFSTVDSPSDLFLGSRHSKIARNVAGTFVGLGEAGGASAAGLGNPPLSHLPAQSKSRNKCA